MSTGYVYFPVTESFLSSHSKLLENDRNAITLNAGTTFPSSPLEGMLCFRTDRRIVYIYEGEKWSVFIDLNNTYLTSMDLTKLVNEIKTVCADVIGEQIIPPSVYHFRVNNGSDLTFYYALKDATNYGVNLSGYKAKMTVDHLGQVVDMLTSENGRLVILEDEGRIKAIFPKDITAKYPKTTLTYDLEIISPNGIITKVIQGKIETEVGV